MIVFFSMRTLALMTSGGDGSSGIVSVRQGVRKDSKIRRLETYWVYGTKRYARAFDSQG
jgi:hypothetical protein